MPIGTEYRDVNDNRIKFEGKTIASVEVNGKRNNLEVLITTKKINSLLGLDWMEKRNKPFNRGLGGKRQEEKFQKTLQRKSHRKWNRGKNTIERSRKTDTAKRKANTDSLATISRERNK